MEHNFMMSEKGRENFKHQLQQVRRAFSILFFFLLETGHERHGSLEPL